MGKYTALSNALKHGVPQLFFNREDQLLLSRLSELDFRPQLSHIHALIDDTLLFHKQQLELIRAHSQTCPPEDILLLQELSLCLDVYLKGLRTFEKYQLDVLKRYHQEHPHNLPPDLH